MPEQRIVLKNCEPGFKALEKAKSAFKPADVINEIKKSGLRGRGGAGFPTGIKWELAAKAQADAKYIVCNADEGEVGAFKDRYILENHLLTLLEGIAIAGYAVGAKKAFIYLRAEYTCLLPKIKKATEAANIFDIEICENAGAYICGEETSLMESIEDKRGEARFKPPFPPASGLWQKPTVINNVETLMNIPAIIVNGADWFSGIGTKDSKGTKVFSVSGDVERPGVYELVMGSSLRELVIDSGRAKDVKMMQVGGASGRVLPESRIDTPLSFETVLGAGAVIVYNNGRSALDMALKSVEFFMEESCGKCSPCREGTAVMYGILENVKKGRASESDLAGLQEISQAMSLCSLCGLGQTAANSFLDTYQLFPQEYKK